MTLSFKTISLVTLLSALNLTVIVLPKELRDCSLIEYRWTEMISKPIIQHKAINNILGFSVLSIYQLQPQRKREAQRQRKKEIVRSCAALLSDEEQMGHTWESGLASLRPSHQQIYPLIHTGRSQYKLSQIYSLQYSYGKLDQMKISHLQCSKIDEQVCFISLLSHASLIYRKKPLTSKGKPKEEHRKLRAKSTGRPENKTVHFKSQL